jgi:hypothetical protein
LLLSRKLQALTRGRVARKNLHLRRALWKMPRKLVDFHPEDLRALQEIAEDRASTLQELMDKAVSDFLKKSGRPASLRDALKQSASRATGPEKQRGRKR